MCFKGTPDMSLSDQLCNACATGNLLEIITLLQNGADVNIKNVFNRTAIQVSNKNLLNWLFSEVILNIFGRFQSVLLASSLIYFLVLVLCVRGWGLRPPHSTLQISTSFDNVIFILNTIVSDRCKYFLKCRNLYVAVISLDSPK